MYAKKCEDDVLLTINICRSNNNTIELLQHHVKKEEKKATFNKSQAINRIIKEWAEDREVKLTIMKKQEEK